METLILSGTVRCGACGFILKLDAVSPKMPPEKCPRCGAGRAK